ncbi:GtrA family protein [Clostridium baratii]|uniref:GtrA family protein n=1 Tax=Clostridium baratii TaxID=1561 RepID=UPI00242AD6D7|nr:GtrA family protein [Clostridium baratii]MBS6043243.1 GtrA family protein [Clostridium baratii]
MYIIFGVLTTVLNFLVYIIFTRVFEANFLISNAVAWLLAVIFAFITNKIYVFNSTDYNIKFIIKEFSEFTISRIFTGLLDIGLLYLFVSIIHMNDLISKIIIGIIITILNYVISKMYVFRGGEKGE